MSLRAPPSCILLSCSSTAASPTYSIWRRFSKDNARRCGTSPPTASVGESLAPFATALSAYLCPRSIAQPSAKLNSDAHHVSEGFATFRPAIGPTRSRGNFGPAPHSTVSVELWGFCREGRDIANTSSDRRARRKCMYDVRATAHLSASGEPWQVDFTPGHRWGF